MTNETPLVSSAQNQEDIMLWRALRHVPDGFYIDVGAADPFEYSVTRIFYERGWHGINLEPNPAYLTALQGARPRDVNLAFGVGRVAGSNVFYVVEGSGLSTFDPEMAARHRADGWAVTERTIETVTLADLCRLLRPEGPIHFLKVDVEGSEGDVLAGADFSTFRPWIVLVEAVAPGTLEPSHEAWEKLLIEHGYIFAWFDGLNRFYIDAARREDLEPHFRVQPNVFDGFHSASDMLGRVGLAEQNLRETYAWARDLEKSVIEAGRHTETLSRTLDETGQALNEAREALTAAQRDRQQLLADLAAAQTHAHKTEMEAQARIQQAELQLRRIRNSSSWRLTAPVRGLTTVVRSVRPDLPPVRPLPAAITPKDLARQVFHRGARLVLRAPGAHTGARLFRTALPGPAEWLALRYRAYGQRAAETPLATPLSIGDLDAMLAPEAIASLDLSEAEARMYRRFLTGGLATNATAAKA